MPSIFARNAALCSVALVATALTSVQAQAQTAPVQRTTIGKVGKLAYEARSLIVGQTSTATLAGGGNPLYFAPNPRYSGVAALIMEYANGDAFICSGSLTNGGRSIVTAAHCVTDANLNTPLRTTAYFYGGGDPDALVALQPTSTAVNVSRVYINELYTGNVIDQYDVAILRLDTPAPSFAQIYDLDLDGDLTGLDINVAGYGARSDTGGAVGANLGTNRRRQGDNRIDFRFGDAAFGGFFDGFFEDGLAETDFSYVSDFDNGLAANDASCQLATQVFGIATAQFCNTGVGAREVGVAGGDSGGPQFNDDGQIISVTSYGLTFGAGFGDFGGGLNSGWGEFSGYAPLFINADFIAASVPEASTWAMMIVGFGLVGAASRRTRKTAHA